MTVWDSTVAVQGLTSRVLRSCLLQLCNLSRSFTEVHPVSQDTILVYMFLLKVVHPHLDCGIPYYIQLYFPSPN